MLIRHFENSFPLFIQVEDANRWLFVLRYNLLCLARYVVLNIHGKCLYKSQLFSSIPITRDYEWFRNNSDICGIWKRMSWNVYVLLKCSL